MLTQKVSVFFARYVSYTSPLSFIASFRTYNHPISGLKESRKKEGLSRIN